MAEPTYPEHEKLAAVVDQSQAIGEFIEWLQTKGIQLCEDTSRTDRFTDYQPARFSTERLLAEFFEIDLQKIEAEKRAMLDNFQRARQTVSG